MEEWHLKGGQQWHFGGRVGDFSVRRTKSHIKWVICVEQGGIISLWLCWIGKWQRTAQRLFSGSSQHHNLCVVCAGAKSVGVDASLHKPGMKWKGCLASVKCVAGERSVLMKQGGTSAIQKQHAQRRSFPLTQESKQSQAQSWCLSARVSFQSAFVMIVLPWDCVVGWNSPWDVHTNSWFLDDLSYQGRVNK